MQVRLPNTVTKTSLRLTTYGNHRSRRVQGGLQVRCCSETVTKSKIAVTVAEDLGNLSQKAVQDVITKTLAEIMNQVSEGNKVIFPGFGSFESRKRNARKGINPKTQEPLDIPETTAVGFKVGKTFKELVRNGGAIDEEEEVKATKSKKK